MNKKWFYISVISMLILTGCQKGNKCEYNAPLDSSLSFDKYNSVSEICYHFGLHDDEISNHIGDTIMVYGWNFLGDETMSMFDNETFDSHGSLYIVDSESHTTEGGRLKVLCVSLLKMSPFYDSIWEMPESWIEKCLYIKGTLGSFPVAMDGCSVLDIKLNAIQIDTIKI